jgi:hypothetical protein
MPTSWLGGSPHMSPHRTASRARGRCGISPARLSGAPAPNAHRSRRYRDPRRRSLLGGDRRHARHLWRDSPPALRHPARQGGRNGRPRRRGSRTANRDHLTCLFTTHARQQAKWTPSSQRRLPASNRNVTERMRRLGGDPQRVPRWRLPVWMRFPASGQNTGPGRAAAWRPCGSACDDRFCDGGVRLANSRAWECRNAQCARTVVVVDRPVARA